MKYEITLITAAGPKTEIYTDSPQDDNFETLQEFEKRMVLKHGDFIMLKAEEIN